MWTVVCVLIGIGLLVIPLLRWLGGPSEEEARTELRKGLECWQFQGPTARVTKDHPEIKMFAMPHGVDTLDLYDILATTKSSGNEWEFRVRMYLIETGRRQRFTVHYKVTVTYHRGDGWYIHATSE